MSEKQQQEADKLFEIHRAGEFKAVDAIKTHFPIRAKGHDDILYRIYRQGMEKGAELLVRTLLDNTTSAISADNLEKLYIGQCEKDISEILGTVNLPKIYKTKKLEQLKYFYISALADGVLKLYEICKIIYRK